MWAKTGYGRLKNRYGPRYTRGMLGAAFVGLFLPIPGSSLLCVAVVASIAEFHRVVFRFVRRASTPITDFTVPPGGRKGNATGRPETRAGGASEPVVSTVVPVNTQDQKRVSVLDNKALVQPRSNGSAAVRVLLADPDESLAPVYQEPLCQAGFELATALSGLACVARMRECAPELLVLEPQLPWGGGDGVLAMMGEVAGLEAVPVLVLTSCRDHRVLKGLAHFPISDYHLKPLPPDRLVGRLRSLLGHPRLRFTLADKTGRLECSIARRTGGRIQDLRVETVGGRVIVRGRSDSHHVKQLALAAVRETFEASESACERVELDIDVD